MMPEIKWQAPEFEHREKRVSWYVFSLIIAVIVIGVAVWQKNFLFGFFVVVGEILIIAWANKEPAVIDFKLREESIDLGGIKSYSYADFENFCVENREEKKFCSIFYSFKSRLKPKLKISAPNSKISEIRKFLSEYLPEIEYEPSLLDLLEEFIGF